MHFDDFLAHAERIREIADFHGAINLLFSIDSP